MKPSFSCAAVCVQSADCCGEGCRSGFRKPSCGSVAGDGQSSCDVGGRASVRRNPSRLPPICSARAVGVGDCRGSVRPKSVCALPASSVRATGDCKSTAASRLLVRVRRLSVCANPSDGDGGGKRRSGLHKPLLSRSETLVWGGGRPAYGRSRPARLRAAPPALVICCRRDPMCVGSA